MRGRSLASPSPCSSCDLVAVVMIPRVFTSHRLFVTNVSCLAPANAHACSEKACYSVWSHRCCIFIPVFGHTSMGIIL